MALSSAGTSSSSLEDSSSKGKSEGGRGAAVVAWGAAAPAANLACLGRLAAEALGFGFGFGFGDGCELSVGAGWLASGGGAGAGVGAGATTDGEIGDTIAEPVLGVGQLPAKGEELALFAGPALANIAAMEGRVPAAGAFLGFEGEPFDPSLGAAPSPA
eukprot:RCo006923